MRTGSGTTELWGYNLQQVDFSSGNWIPEWPLPEATDMMYSNASLKTGGTDGKPVGDTTWFSAVTAIDNNNSTHTMLTRIHLTLQLILNSHLHKVVQLA